MSTNKLEDISSMSNIIGPLRALSVNAPIIILSAVFGFSIFSAHVPRGFFYLFWVAVCSVIRLVIQWMANKNSSNTAFTNSTYSTFLLCFTMFYLVTPGIIAGRHTGTDTMNYPMIMFFLAYIIGDLFSRNYSHGIYPAGAIADLLGGTGLGLGVAALIYASPIRDYLFVVEPDSNGETCSRPAQQQFKCSVYRNGTLVS